MEEEIKKTSPESNTGSDSSIKKNSLRKSLVIIAFIVISLVILVILFVFRKNEKNAVVDNSKENIQKIDNTSKIVSDGGATDSVVNIANYIDSQRNPDGSYQYQSHPDITCPKKDGKIDCLFYKNNNVIPVTAWTSFGYYSAYKVSKDTKFLINTDTDLKTLISWCSKSGNDCNYLLAQPIIMGRDVKNLNVSTFIKKQAAVLASSKPSSDLMLVSIESRELALASSFLNDKSLLAEAKKRLGLANAEIQKQMANPFVKGVELPQFACWATLAGVEIGISENDKQAVRNAVEYLSIGKREQAISEFPNPVNIHPCIETYLLAGIYLNDTGYKDKGRKLLQSFLSDFYDSSSSKILFGENGTSYYSRKKSTSPDTNMILISDTGYTNYLLYLNSTL